MRGIIVSILLFIIFGVVTLLLLLQEKKRTDKIVGELDTYYSGPRERRRAIRLNKRLNVLCRVPEKPNSRWSVFSKDISGLGICLYLPEILPKDAVVDLEIDIPNKRRVIARGKIAWVKEVDTPDARGKRQFNAGVEFIKINPKNKNNLADFVACSLKTDGKGGKYE